MPTHKDGQQTGQPANPEDAPTSAPARRSGRQCGYEHRDELITANRALGAALTRLARDADPAARLAGAALAREVAEYVRAAVVRADESSGRARRAAADLERQLPRLAGQLDQLRTRLHPDLLARNGDHAVTTPPMSRDNAPRSG